jgi:hypothetical protein
MTYKNRRAILKGQDTSRRLDIIRKRGQRVLHRRDVEACALEEWDHFRPAGAVRVGPMNKDHIVHFGRGRCFSQSRFRTERYRERSPESRESL